jgi:hypothetical protein
MNMLSKLHYWDLTNFTTRMNKLLLKMLLANYLISNYWTFQWIVTVPIIHLPINKIRCILNWKYIDTDITNLYTTFLLKWKSEAIDNCIADTKYNWWRLRLPFVYIVSNTIRLITDATFSHIYVWAYKRFSFNYQFCINVYTQYLKSLQSHETFKTW